MDLFGNILIGGCDLDTNFEISLSDFDFFNKSKRDDIPAKSRVFDLFKEFGDLIFLQCHGGNVRPIFKCKRKKNFFYDSNRFPSC